MADKGHRWAWTIESLTLLTVVVGLIFGAGELREIRRSQESQTILELFQMVQTPEYARGLQAIFALPGGLTQAELNEAVAPEDDPLVFQIRLTFENLAVMVFRGDVHIEWVDEMFRFAILTVWDRLGPSTLEARQGGYDGLWEWHQWLVERLLERSGGGSPVPAYEAYREWSPPGQ